MFFPRRPSEARLAELLADARAASPTFDAVGAVERGDDVAGFRRDTYSDVVGADWERACDGLRRWVQHRGSGLRVVPDDAGIDVGETVLALTSVGPLHVVVPCRVAYRVQADDRFGFGYVTLPGHPECGEETFVLSRSGAEVTFTVTSLSHPAAVLSRLGSTVSRVVQRRTNEGYLRAMTDWVASG